MLSAAVVTVRPVQSPLLLTDAKSFLRVDGSALDMDVELSVASAIGDLQDMTSTFLIEQTVEIQADTFDDLAHLDVGPVTAIEAIRYRDSAGDEQLLDPSTYELVGVRLDRGIYRAAGTTLPAMRRGKGAITVALKVGYGRTATDIPPPLRWALLAMARAKFEGLPVDVAPLIVNHRIWA